LSIIILEAADRKTERHFARLNIKFCTRGSAWSVNAVPWDFYHCLTRLIFLLSPRVKLPDGGEYPVRFLLSDPANDIDLLSVSGVLDPKKTCKECL
jgi:hypothetical protein